jgi:hypothetical protein
MRLWPPLLLPAALTPELAPPMQPAAPVIKAPPVPSSVPVQPITLSPPLALQLQRPLPNFAPIPVAAPNPAPAAAAPVPPEPGTSAALVQLATTQVLAVLPEINRAYIERLMRANVPAAERGYGWVLGQGEARVRLAMRL